MRLSKPYIKSDCFWILFFQHLSSSIRKVKYFITKLIHVVRYQEKTLRFKTENVCTATRLHIFALKYECFVFRKRCLPTSRARLLRPWKLFTHIYKEICMFSKLLKQNESANILTINCNSSWPGSA